MERFMGLHLLLHFLRERDGTFYGTTLASAFLRERDALPYDRCFTLAYLFRREEELLVLVLCFMTRLLGHR